jgi:RNA polymerase-binding transcription factor DksA
LVRTVEWLSRSIVARVSDTPDEPTTRSEPPTESGPAPVDLDHVAAQLDGVEAALARLDDGTYWTDEVSGDEIPDHVLAADPVARRAVPE